MSKIYTSKVVEICDNGDAIVELPEELLKELGWIIDDVLDIRLEDECVIIKNKTHDNRNTNQ
jgi:hypothetical protein